MSGINVKPQVYSREAAQGGLSCGRAGKPFDEINVRKLIPEG